MFGYLLLERSACASKVQMECSGSVQGASMERGRANLGTTLAQRRDNLGTTHIRFWLKMVVLIAFLDF